MYSISLVEKIVRRTDTPNNLETHKRIRFVAKRTIGKYVSENIPSVGSIIRYHTGEHYDVLAVIHDVKHDYMHNYSCTIEKDIILEVCKHSNTHSYQDENLKFTENIPLVTEIDNYIPLDYSGDDVND